MSRFKTASQKPLAPAPPALDLGVGKENAHPAIFPAPPNPVSTLNLPLENYYSKPTGKRTLMEAAPIKETRPAKKVKTEETERVTLPSHDSFPPVVDDGQKPPHSYATLIGMAILRAPNRRLTLAQIYKWISDSFKFYNPQDAGWQNSIRHNLSLNKAFIKQERPKDDKGKGNYWAIAPGMEAQFMKEKSGRKSSAGSTSMMSQGHAATPSLNESQRLQTQEPSLPPPAPPKIALSKLFQVQKTAANEPSSDATIPCPISDHAGPDDPLENFEFDSSLDLYSLPAAIHSSPPIPNHSDARSLTPTPQTKMHGSSIFRSHKRKVASMDDSGYISSLESSAMRPNRTGNLLTSEADRPGVKCGRHSLGSAEAEIRRIRSSSYDSPTKSRSHGLVPSSSPYRNDVGLMLPPLTPAMKIKAPLKPPPSVSPNTNLQLHRDKVRHMLNSPLRRASILGEETNSWSPAFNLDNTVYNYNELMFDGLEFNILQDPVFADENGSPVKRSVKKTRSERSHSTTALGEIINSAPRKPITSVPLLKLREQTDSPSGKFDTPSKVLDLIDSPGKLFSLASPPRISVGDENNPDTWLDLEDLDGTGFLAEDVGDFGGLDILQGFEKIGGASQMPASPQISTPTRAPQPRGAKRGLGRSNTTMF